MFAKRLQDIEEYDLGSILGKPDLGVKVKRISDNLIDGKLLKYNFSIEHYILEPGKSCNIIHSQHAIIMYIMSGNASFNGENESIEAKKGDIVFLRHRELRYIDNTSKEPLEILCCIDH